MAQRIKIGLIFSYDENWIGGTYYVLNLIQALKTIEDDSKPHLTIISTNEDDFDKVRPLEYPYISFKILKKKTLSIHSRLINRIRRIIFSRNLIEVTPIDFQIDLLFRGSDDPLFKNVPHHLFWIPDFQEDYLPHFFTNLEINERKEHQKFLVEDKKDVLFSSHDAFRDFQRLYPDNRNRTFILNFAVSHPLYQKLSIEQLLQKYQINCPYFFLPNQFWKHKNHLLVLEALKQIKKRQKLNFNIIFSGKEADYRNPDYFDSLKNYVKQNNLEQHALFLGFIDRSEQLQLMNHSIAILQPSLFEGWSTVVEDAKAMNQNIIVSDLNVHKEQLGNHGYFFKRNDINDLIEKLLLLANKEATRPNFQYKKKVSNFGHHFFQIIQEITN
jgi:glycosyltransferase involved in cell wall biosynthesis